MAHPNVDLASRLAKWADSGVDSEGTLVEGKRKGYIIKAGDVWSLSDKGRQFLEKWGAVCR